MLDHLIPSTPEPRKDAALSFVPYDNATSKQVADAKIATERWLSSMGIEDEPTVDPAYEAALAQHAFAVVTGVKPGTEDDKKKAVGALTTQESVRKMDSMLSLYEQSFVDKAEQIRNYIVHKLLDEAENNKQAHIRLKALKMLGDVTEVGLFTHRVENVTKDLSEEQINEEIRKRLEKLVLNPDTPMLERVDDDSEK